jgi:hypothetical protein
VNQINYCPTRRIRGFCPDGQGGACLSRSSQGDGVALPRAVRAWNFRLLFRGTTLESLIVVSCLLHFLVSFEELV